jgi:hypothetical protein
MNIGRGGGPLVGGGMSGIDISKCTQNDVVTYRCKAKKNEVQAFDTRLCKPVVLFHDPNLAAKDAGCVPSKETIYGSVWDE